MGVNYLLLSNPGGGDINNIRKGRAHLKNFADKVDAGIPIGKSDEPERIRRVVLFGGLGLSEKVTSPRDVEIMSGYIHDTIKIVADNEATVYTVPYNENIVAYLTAIQKLQDVGGYDNVIDTLTLEDGLLETDTHRMLFLPGVTNIAEHPLIGSVNMDDRVKERGFYRSKLSVKDNQLKRSDIKINEDVEGYLNFADEFYDELHFGYNPALRRLVRNQRDKTVVVTAMPMYFGTVDQPLIEGAPDHRPHWSRRTLFMQENGLMGAIVATMPLDAIDEEKIIEETEREPLGPNLTDRRIQNEGLLYLERERNVEGLIEELEDVLSPKVNSGEEDESKDDELSPDLIQRNEAIMEDISTMLYELVDDYDGQEATVPFASLKQPVWSFMMERTHNKELSDKFTNTLVQYQRISLYAERYHQGNQTLSTWFNTARVMNAIFGEPQFPDAIHNALDSKLEVVPADTWNSSGLYLHAGNVALGKATLLRISDDEPKSDKSKTRRGRKSKIRTRWTPLTSELQLE